MYPPSNPQLFAGEVPGFPSQAATTLPRFRQVLTRHGELFQLPLSFGIRRAEGLHSSEKCGDSWSSTSFGMVF